MANVFSRQLPSIAEQLNNYADSANSATTLDSYNNYVSLYNSTIEKYSTVKSDAERVVQARSVIVADEDPLVLKEKDNWLAGGTIINEMYSGGSTWSPTTVSLIANKQIKNDKNSLLMSGNILSYLQYGLGDLLKTIDNFSQFQTFLEHDNRSVSVYKIEINVSTIDGTLVYSKMSDDMSFGEGSYSEHNNNPSNTQGGTLDDLSKAWNSRSDIRGLLTANPLTIGLTIYDVLTNDKVTVEDRISGAILGTVYNTFSNLAMKGIAQMANITAMTPQVMVGFGILGAIFGELVEMVLGLDISFGLGGEYNSGATKAFGQDAFSQSGISEFAGGMSLSLGLSNFNTSTFTDVNGNIIGYRSEVDNIGWNTGDTYTYHDSYFSKEAFDNNPMSYSNQNFDWSNPLGIKDMSLISDINDYSGDSSGINFSGDITYLNAQNGGWGNIGDSGDDDGYGGNNS